MIDEQELESIRLEALLESLKKPEANKREALDEFVDLLGQKNLKLNQEKLIEEAIKYFETSKTHREGPHIKFAREISEDKGLLPSSETDKYSPSLTIATFERIVAAPNAHDEVRLTLLTSLLESKQFTDSSLTLVEETIFARQIDESQKGFIDMSRRVIIGFVNDSIESKLDPDSSPAKLRKFILSKFTTNQLSEPEMWRLFRSLVKESTNYARELLDISKLDGADSGIRRLAAEEVIKLQGKRFD